MTGRPFFPDGAGNQTKGSFPSVAAFQASDGLSDSSVLADLPPTDSQATPLNRVSSMKVYTLRSAGLRDDLPPPGQLRSFLHQKPVTPHQKTVIFPFPEPALEGDIFTSLDTRKQVGISFLFQRLKTCLFSTQRNRYRDLVVAAFEGSGFPALVFRAVKMKDCRSQYFIEANKTHPELSRARPFFSCKDRLCPSCQSASAATTADKTQELLESVRAQGRIPKLMTLTLKHRQGETVPQVTSRLLENFTKIRHRQSWKDHHVRGWERHLEVVPNEETKTWNVHFHILLDCDYWDQGELSEEWERVTGDSMIVDIREAKAGSEKELAKYLLKIGKGMSPERLCEVALGLRGVRTITRGGEWYGVESDDDDDQADQDDDIVNISPGDLERLAEQGIPWAVDCLNGVHKWLDGFKKKEKEDDAMCFGFPGHEGKNHET